MAGLISGSRSCRHEREPTFAVRFIPHTAGHVLRVNTSPTIFRQVQKYSSEQKS